MHPLLHFVGGRDPTSDRVSIDLGDLLEKRVFEALAAPRAAYGFLEPLAVIRQHGGIQSCHQLSLLVSGNCHGAARAFDKAPDERGERKPQCGGG
jgi:hypothetical protein